MQQIIRDIGFSSVRWNSDRYDWQLAEDQGAVVKERINDHLSFIKNHLENSDANQGILDLNHDGSMAT